MCFFRAKNDFGEASELGKIVWLFKGLGSFVVLIEYSSKTSCENFMTKFFPIAICFSSLITLLNPTARILSIFLVNIHTQSPVFSHQKTRLMHLYLRNTGLFNSLFVQNLRYITRRHKETKTRITRNRVAMQCNKSGIKPK